MAWNDDLRPSQEAVAGVEPGDYLLIAGPGTGKTHVLVRRAQFLIEERGLRPRGLTAITFTRAAAGEMRDRLEERLGHGSRPRVATLHSFALSELLTQSAAAIERPVRVVDDWEQRHVVEEELARLLVRNVPDIQTTLKLLASDWDSLAADGDGWLEGFADPKFLTMWNLHRAVYGYTLRAELVYQLLRLYRTKPDLRPTSDVDVFLVDEYQDLNSCDLQAIELLVARSGADVFAAGDDDQSIYSFRMAHPSGIREFTGTYPAANVLKLEECLRCGPEVVQLGNWLIEQELARIPKSLTSVTTWSATARLLVASNEDEESNAITSLVLSAIASGTQPSEILLLLPSDKNGLMSADIVSKLRRRGVDVYLPRLSLGSTNESQRFIEYMKLAQGLRAGNVDDLALRSLLELEANGIGAGRVLAVVRKAIGDSARFSATIDRLRAHPEEFASTGLVKLLAAVDEIITMARSLTQRAGETFLEWVDRVLHDLTPGLLVAEAVREAAQLADATLSDMTDTAASAELSFVSELAASMAEIEDARPPRVDGKVTITTMHGSKGLSADVVFVLHAEDEIIPNGRKGNDLDEQRRLLYVSLTRARKELNIHVCEHRRRLEFAGGFAAPQDRTLTQFLAHYGLVASSARTV